MSTFGFMPNLDVYDALTRAYTQKHRHYHTEEHIRHCLAEFDKVRSIAEHPAEIELALWFHDAIYKTRASDNEEKSAAWALGFLDKNDAHTSVRDRVYDLIMATEHDAPAATPDAQLLIDVDLAILGADVTTYERFEENVRKEYRWVPGPMFRPARTRILQSFLDRERIYATAPFHDRLETAARKNLSNALRALAGQWPYP